MTFLCIDDQPQLTDTEVDEALDDEARIGDLRRAIALLKPDEQTLVTLYYYDSRPLADIAYILDLEPGTIATRLQRIRREQRQAERRQQRLAVAFVAGVALLGLVAIVIFCGATLRQLFLGVVHQPQSLALVLPTLFCLTFFALLNHWLAKHY